MESQCSEEESTTNHGAHFSIRTTTFQPINIPVHGIDETIAASAPSWAEVYLQILPFVTGQIVASHMPFDRAATLRACHSEDLDYFNSQPGGPSSVERLFVLPGTRVNLHRLGLHK